MKILDFLKKLFCRENADEIGKGIVKNVKDKEELVRRKKLDIFKKILKMHVPGFSRIYCGSSRGEIMLDLALPCQEEEKEKEKRHASRTCALWFSTETGQMNVVRSEGVHSSFSDIFDVCLEACRFDGLTVKVPAGLNAFYGDKKIAVFKKGETFKSFMDEVDL